MKIIIVPLLAAIAILSGYVASEDSATVASETVVLPKNIKANSHFNSISKLFNKFSGRDAKSIKMKMGDQSYIQHTYFTELDNASTEVKYDLRVEMVDNQVLISGNVHEYVFYSRNKNKFKIVKPNDDLGAYQTKVVACNEVIDAKAGELASTLKKKLLAKKK